MMKLLRVQNLTRLEKYVLHFFTIYIHLIIIYEVVWEPHQNIERRLGKRKRQNGTVPLRGIGRNVV